jgi:hypothetical protein
MFIQLQTLHLALTATLALALILTARLLLGLLTRLLLLARLFLRISGLVYVWIVTHFLSPFCCC